MTTSIGIEHLLKEHLEASKLMWLSAFGGAKVAHKFKKMLFQKTTRNLEDIFEWTVQKFAPEIILEIGAHEAGFSRRCRAVLPDATVIAYEANPSIFETYQADATSAGVSYLNECIGPSNAPVTFNVPLRADGSLGLGTGSLNMPKDSARDSASFEVPCNRLDAVLAAQQGRAALWIDVEGALDQVFAGAGRSFEQVDFAFIEVEDQEEWAGQMVYADVVRHLADFGLLPFMSAYQRRGQLNVFFLRQSLFQHGLASRARRKLAMRQIEAIEEVRALARADAA